MGGNSAPSQGQAKGSPDSARLLFECTIEVPYFSSQKNAKTIRYKWGRRTSTTGSRKIAGRIPFIASSDKSVAARNFLVSQLQMLSARAGIGEPYDMEMRILLSFGLENFLTKKGKINQKAIDIDNLICMPLDALKRSGIIKDDAYITEVVAKKHYHPVNTLHLLLMTNPSTDS